MSPSASPEPEPIAPEPEASPAVPAEEAASEFISENSPEIRALWAAQVRVVPPVDEVATDPSSGPKEAESTVAALPDSASGAKAAPPALRVVYHGPGTNPPAREARSAAAPAAAAEAVAPPRRTRRYVLFTVIALVVGGAMGTSVYSGLWQRLRLARTAPAAVVAPPADGVATIVSRPAGAEVFINGTSRGVTPLKLTLPVGTYEMELRAGGAQRTLALTVEAATAVREVVDLAPAGGAGGLEVTSNTAGARVTIDGVVRGVTPLMVADIAPGPHRIGIGSGDQLVFRDVTVTAGATATVVASLVPSGASGGWLTITSPIEMQVLEDAQVIGTTGASRLMLPAGRHTLQLVAAPYEFETTVEAQIPVGRSVTIPVTVPEGSLSVNAVPWADVFVDGATIGSTPVGNVMLPIGTHEVVFRHPQFGERRQSVRIAARTPARLSIDMTR